MLFATTGTEPQPYTCAQDRYQGGEQRSTRGQGGIVSSAKQVSKRGKDAQFQRLCPLLRIRDCDDTTRVNNSRRSGETLCTFPAEYCNIRRRVSSLSSRNKLGAPSNMWCRLYQLIEAPESGLLLTEREYACVNV